jgi:hypothetical protein
MKTNGILNSFLLIAILWSNISQSCEKELEKFPIECDLADRYQYIKERFADDFSIDVESIAFYRALRFIDVKDWNQLKEKNFNLPWRIYQPAPRTWLFWERGNNLITNNWQKIVSAHHFTTELIGKIHLELIDVELMSNASVNKKGNLPGVMRNRKGQSPPSWKASCDQYPLPKKDFNLIKNFDLKSVQGKPLVQIKSGKACDKNSQTYKARVVYLDSEYVPKEMESFINLTNQIWHNLKRNLDVKLSPLEFIADFQRRFIAIHPFGDGNGRLSRILQDAIARSFNLPYPPSGKLQNDLTTPTNDYRAKMILETQQLVTDLENCYQSYQAGKVEIDCQSLSVNQWNSSEKQQNEIKLFEIELKKFLSIPILKLTDFFKKYQYLTDINKWNKFLEDEKN